MAKKIMKVGGWYLAYEIGSTVMFAAIVAMGFRFPGI